jgi:hypothetical protein
MAPVNNLVVVTTMFFSLRKAMSGKRLSARSDDGYRAIPRADIWISRPGAAFVRRAD